MKVKFDTEFLDPDPYTSRPTVTEMSEAATPFTEYEQFEYQKQPMHMKLNLIREADDSS